MTEQVPLTYQQCWLWTLLQRWNGWNCTLAGGYCLKGPLNIACLQQSIAETISNHPILRTRICADGTNPCQQVIATYNYVLQHAVVEGSSSAERESRATEIYEEFSVSQFDPTAGPLLCFKLLELSEGEHWLLFAIHRLLVDCFSATLVFNQIWLVYKELHQRGSMLLSTDTRYSDYALMQQQNHDSWAQKHEQYWRQRLEGALPLRWPPQERNEAAPRGEIGRAHRMFDSGLSAGVKDLARRMRNLPGTVMLAIYVSVLWLWCHQNDFVLPFNVAGRQAEHRDTIGFFSHILCLRIELDGTITFRELLRRLSNEFFQALSHQDFGMTSTRRPELLAGCFVQWVTWHGDDTPVRLSAELSAQRLGSRDFTEDLTAIPPGMADLEVTIFDAHHHIHVLSAYRTDAFDAATMERFMDDLYSATRRFNSDPNATVAEALVTSS